MSLEPTDTYRASLDEDYEPPSEFESAMLSLVLFGALLVFGLGCVFIGWN